jgi:phosphatidate phosphatase PAH1
VAAVKKLQQDKRKGQRSPILLYLNTDSEPVIVEIDGTVIDSDAAGSNPADADA